MLNDDIFFYIPIFIRTPEEQEKRCTETAKKKMEQAKKFGGTILNRAKVEFADYYIPLDLNDVIGWLCLKITKEYDIVKIMGEDWRDFHPRKKYRNYELTFLNTIILEIQDADSSADIYSKLIETINDYTTEPYLRNRYVELQQLFDIGPFIDWRALVDSYQRH